MKLTLNNFVPTVVLFAGLVSALGSRHDSSSTLKHRREPLKPRRVSSLLISNCFFIWDPTIADADCDSDPDAQPDLPTAQAATVAASAASLNLDDIQGDVLYVFSPPLM
jgi:hypothetical protein